MGAAPEDVARPDTGRQGIAPAQLAAIVGVVLLLLLLLWFFLLRDDEDVVETPAAPAPVTEETPEEEVVEEEPGGGGNGPVETFEVFAPKDPFDPLISASGVDGAGDGGGEAITDGGTATTDGTTTTTGDGTGTTGDGTGTTGDGTGTTGDGTGTTTTTTTNGGDGSNGGGEDVGGHRVRVIDVYRDNGREKAQVQVDGTVYTVDEGERFAGSFRLMSTSGRCATMLYGDDQFTLCEGEEILK